MSPNPFLTLCSVDLVPQAACHSHTPNSFHPIHFLGFSASFRLAPANKNQLGWTI